MIDVTPERLEEVRSSIFRDDGQNVFSSMLDRCPFCGCEPLDGHDRPGPYVQVWEGPWDIVDARVVCSQCHVSTMRRSATRIYVDETDEDVTRLHAMSKAIADWNRRA